MSHWEDMVSGRPYLASDPEVAAAHRRARLLLERFNATTSDEEDLRSRLLGELLARFGQDSDIRPPFFCDYGTQVSVGARTFANFGLVALDPAPVVIGDDVQIGPNVQLLTATHPIDPEPRRAKWESAGPITIGDNVWLGGGVIVLADVTIGPDTVVGAGSVVTRDLPAGVVAVGSPARVIRSIAADPG